MIEHFDLKIFLCGVVVAVGLLVHLHQEVEVGQLTDLRQEFSHFLFSALSCV